MKSLVLRILSRTAVLGLFISSATASAERVVWSIEPGKSEILRLPVQFPSENSAIIVAFQSPEGGEFELSIVPAMDGDQVRAVFRKRAPQQDWQKPSEEKLSFWPHVKSEQEALEEDGIKKQNGLNRLLMLRLDVGPSGLVCWLEGRILASMTTPVSGSITVSPLRGALVGEQTAHHRNKVGEKYELVEIPGLSDAKDSELILVDGIPFEVWDQGKFELSLEKAGWPDWKRDPAGFNQAYDGGPYFIGDLRMPFSQVPNAGYSFANFLVRSEDAPGTTNRFSLRLGRRVGGYSDKSQVLTRDYTVEVPQDENGAKFGRWHLIRVPIAGCFPMLVEGDVLDLELTKEIRLARRQPDPNSFRWRPLGLPSNVKIMALTLERSPLQMDVRFANFGNAFEKTEVPRVEIKFRNAGATPIKYALEIGDKAQWKENHNGELEPGGSRSHQFSMRDTRLGVHPFVATVSEQSSKALLQKYETTYGVLPERHRPHREKSAFGIGGSGGGKHFTPADGDAVSELASKLGVRYLNGLSIPYEDRYPHGLRQGTVLSMRPGNGGANAILQRRKERLAEHPDSLDQLLIFHEDAISGLHASRVPDIFHDRPPYQLNAEETARFEKLHDEAIRTAKLFREHHPEVELQLGNGSLVVREEFYRRGFPKDLFDTGGNENPSFSRPPESQPPDMIGNNSSLWMDRQLLDHYGFSDKVVTQCHETIYPSSNPGNLAASTQANYLVRHYLHSLAWKIPQIRGGGLFDKGNSYKNSNWGQTGLFTARPDVAPKPGAAQMAALTKVLDGAEYKDFLETGSGSVYVMRFQSPDGMQILPFWTVRGTRGVHLGIKGSGPVSLISGEGEEQTLMPENGEVFLQATAKPAYLRLAEGMTIGEVRLDAPVYPHAVPVGKFFPLDPLASLQNWKLQKDRNPLLEFYNPLAPRRQGNFQIEAVSQFEGKNDVLRIRPLALEGGKPTMPMYGELRAPKPLALSGKPVEIGLWVNGNSSWGRIIFELEDSSGQRWMSIGARSKKGGSPWMADWLGKDLAEKFDPGEKADWNTDDAWGLSRINFDGWRYLGFPLPGNYPGENYPWPANSQWRWDKDGVVHYPLKITGLTVELPEKTLYLTRYAPPSRPEIYLSDLSCLEDDGRNDPKTTPLEVDEEKQVRLE